MRVFAASLLSLTAWIAAAAPEQPLYQGQPLDYWIKQLQEDGRLAREEALAVLADVGPAAKAALPRLNELLSDPAATVRLKAAVAVWKVGRRADAAAPVLVEALKGSGRADRLLAVKVLAEIGPEAKEALPAVAAVLDDADAAVRQAASDAVQQAGAAAVPVLVGRLHHKEPAARREAAAALERLGPDARDAVAALKEALKDDDGPTRLAAAAALTHIDPYDDGAVKVLIDAAGDADPATRRRAAERLLLLRHPPAAAAPAFAALLKDDVELRVRLDAADALWRARRQAKEVLPTLRDALKNGDISLRQRALLLVMRLGPEARDAVPDLIPLAQDANAPYLLGDVCAAVGPDVVPPLMEVLRGKNAAAAQQAGGILGAMGADAAPSVLKLLDDPDPQVRSRALTPLSLIGPSSPKVIPALVEIAKNEKDPLRAGALNALAMSGPDGRAAVPLLLADLDSPERGRRTAASINLQKLPLDRAALPALDRAAKDDDVTVRRLAVVTRWHVNHDTAAAVDALVDLTKDPKSAGIAVNALGDIAAEDAAAVPALAARVQDPNAAVRINALFTLERLGPNLKAGSDALAQALKGADDATRFRVACLLARSGADAADVVPILTERLKARGPTAPVPVLAALGQYGKEAAPAAPAVRDMLTAPGYLDRVSAAEALWRIDPSQKDAAVDVLLDAIGAGPFTVGRYPAVATLARVDPSNRKLIALLRAALTEADPVVCNMALATCAQLGPAAAELLPLLGQTAEDETDDNRPMAATAVWKVSGRTDRAAAALVKTLKGAAATATRSAAAVRLGEMGADAASAGPALRDALVDRSWMVRAASAAALRKVDPAAADKAGVP